ncbi:LuxR C-terminal-related transcriptional regulator [Leisingera sp. S132]|uniref:helix-turn-helix transcriptional regulator n=1 Tax=Leisingera sp. S132 TaxID=2867016 RepID=UPI0021A290F2|nr:LuxR C-terminal-related transcriptional regulator [Leisingera sp. S132]UWQ77628.1 LuxR C-terminal-related transcriptional regulator [Leisingera sp. S132]
MQFFSDVPADLSDIAPHGLALGIGSFRTGQIDVHTTYSNEWQGLYHERGWLTQDPAVTSGLSGPGIHQWDAESIQDADFKDACFGYGLKSGTSITDTIAGSSCLVGLTINKAPSEAATEAATRAVREAHMGYLTTKAQLLLPQHIDVVYLAAKGYRAKEISAKLDISEETVKQRKTAVQSKIGVNNFTAAVNICAIAGLTLHPIK